MIEKYIKRFRKNQPKEIHHEVSPGTSLVKNKKSESSIETSLFYGCSGILRLLAFHPFTLHVADSLPQFLYKIALKHNILSNLFIGEDFLHF